MENSNQINPKNTFNLKRVFMWGLLLGALLVAGWFINSSNLVFLSERLDKQLNAKIEKLSRELKREQNNTKLKFTLTKNH